MNEPTITNLATLKLAVVGSRGFYTDKHAAHIFGVLDGIRLAYPHLSHIVSGGAKGPDTRAKEWAKERGIELIEYPANWEEHGKAAGFVRNAKIAVECDAMIAFWDGTSKGTLHAIGCARAEGKHVFVDMLDGQGLRQMP